MQSESEKQAEPSHLDRNTGMIRRITPLFFVAAIVFGIDQSTKALIRSWLAVGEVWPADAELLRLSHVQNTGAAFGILQGAGPFLMITTAIAILLIALVIIRSDTYARPQLYAFALILGGAVGNLTDRIVYGSVTDFIDPTHYPSFNFADSSIVIGVLVILLLNLFYRPEDSEHCDATKGQTSD